MSNRLIHVDTLTVRFSHAGGISEAVKQVSFSIHAGQCVGLVGESGSGKSMTALAMMQLLPNAARVSAASSVTMHGEDLLQYSQRQIRKVRGGRIAMVFQDASTALNPVKTVAQQIKEVLQLHTAMTTQQIKNRTIQLLQEVGIREPAHCCRCYPHELSGGMRQRVMIAMALGCEPELLIADEPTTALDVTVQAQVIDLLKSLQRKHGMAMLFISHDLAVVSQLADSIVVLRRGEVVESATASDFFSKPKHPYSQHLLRSLPDMRVTQTHVDTPSLLQVDSLKVHFPIKKGVFKRTVGHVRAVDGVSFAVNEGQTLAIVGESGSGKTTTAKALVRLLRQTQGKICWQGQDIAKLTRQGRRQWHTNIQMIFQDPYAALNPRMRIFDSIVEGLVAQRRSQSQAQLVARIDELLEQVCLPLNAKWCYPHEFSGGERQRICVARALALQPTCLILDEPTSSLDVSIQMQVLQLLVDLQQQHQLSYILITHNISVVAALAHTVMVMYQGKAVEQGTAAEVLFSPRHPYTQQLLQAVPVLETPNSEE